MTVRCKFELKRVETQDYNQTAQNADGTWGPRHTRDHTLIFQAVTGGSHASEENRSFWEATPSGELKVTCTSGKIADEMAQRIGESFYIDIIAAAP